MKRLTLLAIVAVLVSSCAAPTAPRVTSRGLAHGLVDCKGELVEDPDTGLCVERGK